MVYCPFEGFQARHTSIENEIWQGIESSGEDVEVWRGWDAPVSWLERHEGVDKVPMGVAMLTPRDAEQPLVEASMRGVVMRRDTQSSMATRGGASDAAGTNEGRGDEEPKLVGVDSLQRALRAPDAVKNVIVGSTGVVSGMEPDIIMVCGSVTYIDVAEAYKSCQGLTRAHDCRFSGACPL